MASGRIGGRPLHPTNLHVNRSLFPNDTVQGRLPDPGWLTRWLDEQIRFDEACEERVVRAILRSLSALLGETFETVRDLNRFRKAAAVRERRVASQAPPSASPAEAG
jgi:hypothetical protein